MVIFKKISKMKPINPFFVIFTYMVTETTHNITISVETFYQPSHSDPINSEYMFAYRITIFNESDFPVQLLRRHWYIWDANNHIEEVEGEGVIGEQPIIAPGMHHQYVSGCHLNTPIGKMHGKYLMTRTSDRKQFYVNIPEFMMTAPQIMN